MKISDPNKSLDFEVRRLDLLYRQNLWGVVSVFVCSTAFLLTVYPRISLNFVLPWYSILNLSAIARFVLYRRWQSAKESMTSPAQARPWLYAMAAMLFVSGTGWGFIGWLSPGSPVDQQAVTTLIISAMVGGALATNASSKICMYSMSVPALGLWALGMLRTGDRHYVLMGIFVTLFMGMMVLVGRNLNQFVVNAIRLNAKLRESEERLRVARDSAQTLSWNWDLRRDEILCEGNLNLFSNPEDRLRRLLRSRLDKEDALDIEAELLDEVGVKRYITVRGQISRSSSGQAMSVAGICLDMTSQKNAETMRLERDVLDAANKSKSVFVANASHELRTPLSAIIGFAEAMLGKPEFPESLRNDARVIVRHGKYMVSLVGDLLDLSKIETKRLFIQKAWMNPVQEIQDSVSVIRPSLDYKKLALEVKYLNLIPEKIESDATRFRQVLINLLSNAVKFTASGKICVEVSYSESRHRLLIRVRDTGLGMSDETRANLFKPFVRGETPEIQRVQGSGLGLALSRNLARLMGGDLVLSDSVQGTGSEFEFAVDPGPLANLDFVVPSVGPQQPPGEIAPMRAKAKALEGRRILLVEDSEDLQELMKYYLEAAGAVVSLAENGERGVHEALGHNFDVVLMDIKMPTMDGYEATKNLRDQGYRQPIVALTANASTEDRELCYRAGCDDYLSKPVDLNLLYEVLSKRCASGEALV